MNLSIKNVPEDVVQRLRGRAMRNHRSMQGEMLVILEKAADPRKLTLQEVRQRIKALGLKTGSESVGMIREDRDAR